MDVISWTEKVGRFVVPPSPRRRLERVIQIRMASPAPKPRTDEPVRRQQKYPPSLKLADVYVFMGSASDQAIVVPGQDNVPERHRRPAAVEPAAP
jgi:hypothetical protein